MGGRLRAHSEERVETVLVVGTVAVGRSEKSHAVRLELWECVVIPYLVDYLGNLRGDPSHPCHPLPLAIEERIPVEVLLYGICPGQTSGSRSWFLSQDGEEGG